MSLIPTLKADLSNLPLIISMYEDYLDSVEQDIRMKGKTLQQANVEHAERSYFYDSKRVELNILKKYLEREVERIRGKQWKQITTEDSRMLNTKDKENFINAEQAYLDKHSLYLEVLELSDKFQAISDAFKSRGFALNNLVKLRTSSIENDVI